MSDGSVGTPEMTNLLYTFKVGHSPSIKERSDSIEAGYWVRLLLNDEQEQQWKVVSEMFKPAADVVQRDADNFMFDVVVPDGIPFALEVFATDGADNSSKARQYADVAANTIPLLPPGYVESTDLVPVAVCRTDMEVVLKKGVAAPTVEGQPVGA